MPAVKRLILLRHGRTAWNRANRIQGQLDVPLDDTGLAQAEAAAPVVARYEPAVVWSSDLARAAVTADKVAAACGLPVSRDQRLRERHFGERQGLTHEEYRLTAPEEYAAFRAGDHSAVAGGEKLADLTDRVTAALHDLAAATPEGGTAVAVAHGGAIRSGVAGLLGWGAEGTSVLRGLDNCHWAELRLDPAGRAVLVAYNLGA